MASRLPIGIQSFEDLRSKGFKYIDKTGIMYRLVDEGKYYFLSRPRRFGKSLFLSTLEAYFLGKRDLFMGLAVEKLERDWTEHPVFHLDLNTRNYSEPDSLRSELSKHLELWEAQYGDKYNDRQIEERFSQLIRLAYEKTGRQVVILVDEYDKPMLEAIGRPELQDDYRATLRSFYGALKSCDAWIRFAFLTGVTKFGKVSVFSGLNNLRDLSMLPQYYNICGISETELHTCFTEEIDNLASNLQVTREDAYAALKKNYDGYRFTAESSIFNGDKPRIPIQGIYNPFSVLNALANSIIGSYWFETGTPSYLVQLLQKHDYSLEEMSRGKTTEDILNSIDAASTNPIPVIYQSGYLTIKDYDPRFRTYTLGFPNAEVEEGFTRYLMPCYINGKNVPSSFQIDNFVMDVEEGRTGQFVSRLRSLFADTPYELIQNLENHYRNVVWLLFKLMGFYTQAEYRTSEGRIDLVVGTPKYVYVMEFKLDGTAEEALQQIQDKSYTLPFEMDGRQIIRIGINFDRKTRNIDKVLVG